MSYLTYNGKLVKSNNKFAIKTISVVPSLELTWNNIINVPVANPASVSDWNTLFNLPTLGTPFTSADVIGNMVSLKGGSGITTKNDLFNSNGNLIEVSDSGTITAIGPRSFAYCTSLISSIFSTCTSTLATPASTPVGSFQNCLNMISASFPALITAGEATFSGCSSLDNPEFPLLQTIKDHCFANCTTLSSVDFPSLKYMLGFYNFMNCTSLTNPTFPELLEIASSAFTNCTNLMTTSYPKVAILWSSAFYTCPSLLTASLPLCTIIQNGAFQHCTNLDTLYVPRCTDFGGSVGNNNIFTSDCTALMSITIDISRETCDAGNPDGDILYAESINPSLVITYVA